MAREGVGVGARRGRRATGDGGREPLRRTPQPCSPSLFHPGDYLAAMAHVILPVAHEFAPDVVILSAGFDAAAGDPIGGCCVSAAGFAHMAYMVGDGWRVV